MKLGFSTLACPDWDLATIARQAKDLGYQGIELSALGGRPIAPGEPVLAADPPAVRKLFADAGIELACLGTPVGLYGPAPGHAQAAKSEVRAYIDLAARLGCPLVRVFGGEIPPRGDRNTALTEIAAVLRDLALAAAASDIEIVLENDGVFPGSRDLWFILDAVDHPTVRCCWNPLPAVAVRERPTLSVPRLGTRIGVVHLCDARFGPDDKFEAYELPGAGQAELPRLLDLLHGIAYDGYVIFDWPKTRLASLAPPEQSLPAAAKFMKERIEAKGEVLTAYKGDKTAPRFSQRPPRPPVRIP